MLQESHDLSRAQYEACRIEPWEALQLDMDQCRTLTLVTSVELLQSLYNRGSNESKPAPVTSNSTNHQCMRDIESVFAERKISDTLCAAAGP